MTKLSFKTIGNSNPKGKPKVYFCCHMKDFEKFFESISNEIMALQNCSVWYRDFSEGVNDELLSDLKQMQLFVMPVTTNLLCTENDALDIEFKYAIKNHIPVLPLMQEPGLEQLFNQKCGELQFLDKNNTDSTAISYNEKLKSYLESVLIGDELAEKIRAAFDAYVFLSYRKKDRKYAQELMRLIHKNEFCRDIAIWYDEFLALGENFNDSIKEALQKSGLFVLAVTPSLLEKVVDDNGEEKDNYIITTEYPMARKEGKPVLPAELVPTDREELSQKYEDIPTVANAHNDSELSNALLESIKKMAIKENDKNPEHNFFIGLAYLGGVDVEVDHERAIALITSAAESGLPEAIRKLVNIYHEGIGIKKDCLKAIEWQSKLVFLDGEIRDNVDAFYLAKLYQEVGQFANAQKWYEIIRVAGAFTIEQLYYYAMSTYELGNILFSTIFEISGSDTNNAEHSQKTYQEVEALYTECIKDLKTISEDNSKVFEFNIYDVYFGFAKLFFDQLNYEKSRFYLSEVLLYCDSADDNDKETRAKLTIEARFLSGNIFAKQENWDAALDEYKVALYKIKEFNNLLGKTLGMTYEGDYYQKCAELYFKCNELERAIDFANSSMEIRKAIAEENPFCYNWSLLSKSYDLLSKIYINKGDKEKSSEYAKLAFFSSFEGIKQTDGSNTRISNDIVQQMESYFELSESGAIDNQYCGYPLNEKQLKYKVCLEKRMELCKQGINDFEEAEVAVLCYKELAGLYFENNNYIEAVKICLELLDKLERHYRENSDRSITGLLANCYSSVGKVYSHMYKMSTSLDYSIKAMELIEPLQKRYEKTLKEYEDESSIIIKESAVNEIESIARMGFLDAIEFMVNYYTENKGGDIAQDLVYWQSILAHRYAINCSLENTDECVSKYESSVKELVSYCVRLKDRNQAYTVCRQYQELMRKSTGDQLVLDSLWMLYKILENMAEDSQQQEMLIATCFDIACMYKDYKIFDDAEKFFNRCMTHYEEFLDHKSMACTLKELASIYLKTSKIDKANETLLKEIEANLSLLNQYLEQYSEEDINESIFEETFKKTMTNIGVAFYNINDNGYANGKSLAKRIISSYEEMRKSHPNVFVSELIDRYYVLGCVCRKQNCVHESESALKYALSLNEKFEYKPKYKYMYFDDVMYSRRIGAINTELGDLYYCSKEYYKAIEAYNYAIKVRKNIIKIIPVAISYLTLADSYRDVAFSYENVGDYSNAEKAYKECARLRQKFNKDYSCLVVLIYLGDMYLKTNRYGEAEQTYLEVVKTCKEHITKKDSSFEPLLADAYDGLGCVYKKEGKVDDSQKMFVQSLEIAKRHPNDKRCKRIMGQ